MHSFPILHTDRLTLRGLQNKDISLMIKYLNNDKISKQVFNIPYPFSHKDSQIRVDFITNGYLNRTRYVFVIANKENDEFIGQIGLHIDKENNNAEIGYVIAEPFWGKGFATEANIAVLKFGFEEIQLHKIFATHFTDNPASEKVLINSQMIKEGEIYEHYKRGDIYKSVNQYRLTQSEYEAL